MTNNTVIFLDTPCQLRLARYRNGRLAIQLHRADDGLPVATATVNVPSMPLEDQQVLIKDYAENQGILAALERAGIVRATNRRCRVGYEQANVCRLLIATPTVH